MYIFAIQVDLWYWKYNFALLNMGLRWLNILYKSYVRTCFCLVCLDIENDRVSTQALLVREADPFFSNGGVRTQTSKEKAQYAAVISMFYT